MGRKINNLTGKRFERLLVIKSVKRKGYKDTVYWECKCDYRSVRETGGLK